jgi:hypothetical protein
MQHDMGSVFALLGQLACCSRSSEAFQSFGQPHKLLTEEKIVFDFIESLATSDSSYFEFLFGFLKFSSKEQRSESFVRRTLLIFYHTLLKGRY